MLDPRWGPFLFDTSAESWLFRSNHPEVQAWIGDYLAHHQVHVSAVSVVERVRGFALLWRRAPEQRRAHIEAQRVAYLSEVRQVWPIDAGIAVVGGEIMALVPEPPTPPKRTHRALESRQERLARWHFDSLIAATALVRGMPLLHNNAADFEAIRGAIERSPTRFPQLGPLQLTRCTSVAQ